MHEVLVSIHAKWTQKIYAGLKTAEIRKSLPRLPFKVRFLETGGSKLITGEATVMSTAYEHISTPIVLNIKTAHNADRLTGSPGAVFFERPAILARMAKATP